MNDTTTVVARYLALGGAHVAVNRGGRDRCKHAHDAFVSFDSRPHTATVDAACEACGDVYGIVCAPGLFYSEKSVIAEAMTAAEKHAETCRRIPQRLWPEGGAR